MFLTLNHQRLNIYDASIMFVLECYKLTNSLPNDEKFGMISQIRRASLSVHLNVAERASRKSETERKCFYEIARGSIIEIDVAKELGYLKNYNTEMLGVQLLKCFKLLSGLIQPKIQH